MPTVTDGARGMAHRGSGYRLGEEASWTGSGGRWWRCARARSCSLALPGDVGVAIRTRFAGGINDLVVVTGTVAVVGAALSLVLMRNRDFHHRQPAADAGTADDRGGATVGAH